MELNKKFKQTKNIILYLPIVAIIAEILVLSLGNFDFFLMGSYIAVPIILASAFFKKYRNNPSTSIFFMKQTENSLFTLLVVAYFLGLTISMILLYILNLRTFFYYLTITFVSLSLLFEILLFDISSKKIYLILIQIMILSLNIIFSVTLKYHFFIGGGDSLVHFYLIKQLINSNHVTDSFGIYKPFPLWHIFNSILYYIAPSIPLNKIMFLATGCIYSFIIPFIYYISSNMFNNKKVGLLSALFVCFFQGFIYYGMYSIPRSIASFFEVILIYLLFPSSSKKMLLAIFITLLIIMFHTVSIPYVLMIFVTVFLFNVIYTSKENDSFLTLSYIILTITLTLFYWLRYADKLFQAVIEDINAPNLNVVSTQFTMYSSFDKVFNYLHFSPLLFFVIIGILYVLDSKKYSISAKIFSIVSVSLISVTYPGPLFMLTKLSSLNITRFEQYTFLFICSIGAVGFLEIYPKTKKYSKVLIILFFILMCLLSISNDYTASDNPLVKKPSMTNYLSDEEIIAYNHIGSINRGYIMGDYLTYTYFINSAFSSQSLIIGVNNNGTKFLQSGVDNTLILIRDSELKKRPLFLYTSIKDDEILNKGNSINFGKNLNFYGKELPLYNNLISMDKIYTSGGVITFRFS